MRFALCLCISVILHALLAWRIALFRNQDKLDADVGLERAYVEISLCERDVESAAPSVAVDTPAIASAPKPPEVRVLVSEVEHDGYGLELPHVRVPEPEIEPSNLPQEVLEAPEQAHVEGSPEVRETIHPKYPRAARERGMEGDSVLKIEVASDGTASSVVVVESSGYDLLDEAAVKAARAARYNPATRDGVPVSATFTLRFTFRLRQ